MFNKVLIAEDHESSNISIRKALEDFGVLSNDYVYYCDDALTRISHAIRSGKPYDLLITDLSFDEDDTPQKISSGTELIKAVKEFQPDIKILVFSAESKPATIDNLFKELSIDAFVRKARRDVTELKLALEAIFNKKTYLSTELRRSIQLSNTYEFKEYDIVLITSLSKGMLQKDIPGYLEKKQIKPYGLSSVEKRLNYIKEALNFTKNEQLIAFCKDIGVI
ncbi:DNA-binding response regulator, NarL/FixJ family, contains REC and HTH domains [Daejeonella rubra]|uniref:DNA-binding response regulator, NarL/FixJ family, contains REC and HTH domains n=1 Tax=Daejeonella rubra TaxID=990371 RepID=A0A1G9Q7D9_9SPHI|nr:response regulator [Daejeonella rubra]SDM06863.1 DNA-binding response regulator, NarL/FixJ family, contains REC and HTH domains [Daejeonella rubra]